MAVIAAGQPAPEFSLARPEGEPFTRADLEGKRTLLVFYPFAFSSVCTEQLSIYNDLLGDFAQHGLTLYGVSCDAAPSQQAFSEQLGDRDRAALGLRAQGRGLPRVRRPAPRRLPAARARADRPRRRRRVEPRGRLARRPAGRQPDLRRARPRDGLSEPRLGTAAARRPRRSRPGAGGGAAGRRLRRLRVPVLRGARAAPARAAAARRLPPLPRRARATRAPGRRPRPPRRRRRRARSGRCTTAVRRPGAARGPAPVGARRAARARRRALRRRPPLRGRSRQRIAADFRAGVRAGVATTPTLFADGERHSGRPEPGVLERAGALRR